MKKLYLLLALSISALCTQAQFTDGFTDGDFTSNPTWTGDVADYTVVTNKLRSNNSVINSTFYLSTPSTAIINTQWELGVNLQFNTSGPNLVDIYLTSNQANLKATNLNAYFVRIGETTDEISLWKKVGGISTKIITGTAGVTNVSNNNLKIKVTHDAANLFSLYYDVTGIGTSYTLAGTVTDNAVTTSVAFGFLVKQSTASFFQKHFFDDIYVGPIILDTAPPTIVSNTVISNTQIDVLFSEPLDAITANTANNYTLNNGATITTATLDASNKALVHIATSILSTNNYTLTINNVNDLSANTIASNSTTNFNYSVSATAVKGDIVINEIYADNSSIKNATTLVGKGEYVELYNRSAKNIQLNGFVFSVNTTNRTLPNYTLNAGSYVLLCASADTAYYNQNFGLSIVGFGASALINSGATLTLKDNNSTIISTIKYADTWYKDDIKKDGGISLERINPNDSCFQYNNWLGSSNATIGGTPAAQNSVYSVAADVTGPVIIKARVTALNQITLTFNESVDTVNAKLNINYSVSNQVITNSKAIAPDYTTVLVTLANNLDTGVVYTVNIANVQDCNGTQTINQTATVIIYTTAKPYDVVINELFADPDPSIGLPAFEYIELYNRSAKTLNIDALILSIGTNKINLPDAELKPNSYLLLARDGAVNFGITNYAVLPENISLSNDGSLVQLYDSNNVMIHAVNYNLDYYHSTYKKDGGWSMELKNYNNPCGIDDSWSASTANKGGTPGVVNSVFDANYKDATGPKLVRAYPTDSVTVHLFFDESIDARTLKNTDISINTFGTGIVTNISNVNELSTEVTLSLSAPLLRNVVYSLSLTGKIKDCVGNEISTYKTTQLALPQALVKGDIIVNEMMTYPNDFATDWIELYNTSNKAIDLKNVLLATYDRKNKLVESAKNISEKGFIIYPNDYAVLTTKLKGVTKFYTTPAFEKICVMVSLPTYSSDTSIVLLLRGDERLDSVFSNAKYHFPLLNSTKGVSLERLSAARLSGDATNWHSAAQAIGYGTPTYKNSQNAEGEATSELTIVPEVFSPDEDGYNDVITFYYKYDAVGYVLNAYVYAIEGQLIKRLKTNELLAIEGSFSWNGIADNGVKAPVGSYVVYFEAYDINGNFKKYKRTITIATKL
ncbi:MAG: lamin tail domain-containing protein [Bacteroidia bacterium]|nr:lamin tail domain-containing protein [Bacteroidia bacterium]